MFYEGARERENPGFDAVVGNPPYVNVLNVPKVERDYILDSYPSAQGRVDVYIPFIELSILLLRDGGVSGSITPNKYTVYGYGRLLRDLLLQDCIMTHFVDLAKCPSVFPEAATYTAITIFRNSIPSEAPSVQCIVFEKDIPELLRKPAQLADAAHVLVNDIPVSRFFDAPQHVISPRLWKDNWDLFTKCKSDALELGEHFKVEQCIRIGSTKTRKEVVIDGSQLNMLSSAKQGKARKVLDAEELTKFTIDWHGRYLLYEPSKLYNPKSPELLDNPKVLVKDTSTRLQVAFDIGEENGNEIYYYYPLNTVYAIVPREALRYDVRYLTAILNCPLFDYLYKMLFGALTISGGYVRFREYLQHLPIRQANFTTPPEERSRLVEEAGALYEQTLAKSSDGRARWTVLSELVDMAERTDVAHDFLVGLAEQASAERKKRIRVARTWREWVETAVPNADKLTKEFRERGWIEVGLRDGWDGVKAVFQAKGAVPPSGVLQDLRRETEGALGKLRPLYERIEATDRLIDQIVYRLYGLTEEEISVVEESVQVG